MNNESLTEALIELQQRYAFQEETLQQLSDELLRQQRDINALRLQLSSLKEQVDSGQPETAKDEPPPHY